MKHIRWKGGERVLSKVDEGKMNGEIEDKVMEEEREIREKKRRLLSPLKVPDSIETRLLD